MNNNPYQSFSKYLLRAPLFSFSLYRDLTSKKNIPDDIFIKICKDKIFQESIFLASPDLYKELNKWLDNSVEDKKKTEKLKTSILKYISRMSSRCTPFGLFAGYSIGEFAEENEIILEGAKKNSRNTRLDMNYLVALSQDLEKIKPIKKQLYFFPNSSIYKIGNQFRFIEYRYHKNRRTHYTVAVEHNQYLDSIIEKARNGALIKDLVIILVNQGIDVRNAIEYVNELISSQMLISELEPSVSGIQFLDHIILVLKKLKKTEHIVNPLEEITKKLRVLDKNIGNEIERYNDIVEIVKKLNTEFDLKYLFQTDMILNSKKNILNKEIYKNLNKGFTLLNKISLPPKATLLSRFRDTFYERYEEEEILISKALDVELGIAYSKNQNSGDINPLIDSISLANKKTQNHSRDLEWTSINDFFQKKLVEALKSNSYSISLNDKDFLKYEAKWDDLPDTISFMIEFLHLDGKEKLKLIPAGSSSAANILGRFCYGEQKILDYINEIIETEAQINKDKILAEIVHLPESRMGNILMRPNLRSYEIPYLSRSNKPEEFQLPLDDLMISIKKQNRILIRSKKHNKEVIPRLANSHYYPNDSLPVYHFLADMQTQGIRNIGFSYGPFTEDYEFLPRVEYCDMIFKEATWNLNKSHIALLIETKNYDDELLANVKKMRNILKLPKFVMLVEGEDNKLLINLENLDSIRMFLDIASKSITFKLIEFLFNESGVVKQAKEYYTNEIIMSFYNTEKLKKSYSNE